MAVHEQEEEDEEYDSPIVRLSPEERSAITEHEKDGQVAVTFSLPYQVCTPISISHTHTTSGGGWLFLLSNTYIFCFPTHTC